jgi:type II secretory pathway pseudopilin PulG
MNWYRVCTLIELLVVMIIIEILAALLLPVLSRGKESAQRAACLNDEKQLGLAWHLYAADANEALALNGVDTSISTVPRSTSNSWVAGNVMADAAPATITGGSLFPYVKSVPVYKCLSDKACVSGTNTPILRTYSLSCFVGGPTTDVENWGVQPLYRTSRIRNAVKTLTFIHEDDSTLDDGHFLYSAANNVWLNIPAWQHRSGTVLSFVDGHGEYWKWRGSLPTVTYFQDSGDVTDPASLADGQRLQETAPDGN